MTRSLIHPSEAVSIDPRRIAANTGVVVLHALAFAVLMMPSRWEPSATPRPAREPVVIEEFVPPEPIAPTTPPPVQPPRIPETRIERTPATIAPVPVTDVAPVFDTGEIAATPGEDVGPEPTTFDPGPPQLATLAYDVYPAPRYPRASLRAGDEGRVLLRVLVDAQGRPLEVLVEEGSGHRELDRAAREQVLSAWRFHPAQRGGRAVAAWALVPIDFKLP